MQPEQVLSMLRSYRGCAARITHIRCEIQMEKARLKWLEETAVEDMQHVTASLTGMPRSGRIGDQSANIAVKLADGYETDEVKQTRRRILDLEANARILELTSAFVEAWLSGLTQKERFVIERRTIDGMTWECVAEDYEKEFGVHYSKDTVRRINRAALEKIYRIAS